MTFLASSRASGEPYQFDFWLSALFQETFASRRQRLERKRAITFIEWNTMWSESWVCHKEKALSSWIFGAGATSVAAGVFLPLYEKEDDGEGNDTQSCWSLPIHGVRNSQAACLFDKRAKQRGRRRLSYQRVGQEPISKSQFHVGQLQWWGGIAGHR